MLKDPFAAFVFGMLFTMFSLAAIGSLTGGICG